MGTYILVLTMKISQTSLLFCIHICLVVPSNRFCCYMNKPITDSNCVCKFCGSLERWDYRKHLLYSQIFLADAWHTQTYTHIYPDTYKHFVKIAERMNSTQTKKWVTQFPIKTLSKMALMKYLITKMWWLIWCMLFSTECNRHVDVQKVVQQTVKVTQPSCQMRERKN